MGRSSKWLRKLLGVKKAFKSHSKDKASATPQDQRETDSAPTEKYVPALPMHHVQDSVLTAIPETESACTEVEDLDSKEIGQHKSKLKEVAVEEDLKQNFVYDVNQVDLNRACQSESFKAAEEQAAIKIQKAFRRYLAYRAFRALKGLVRLQALVRGHVVRKQAAVSVRCVEAIVKVQAIFRGFQVRVSPKGRAVRKHLWLREQDANSSETLKNNYLKIRGSENPYDQSQSTESSIAGKPKSYKQRMQAYAPTTHYIKNFSTDYNEGSGWIWLELWTAYRPWASFSSNRKCISATYHLENGVETTEAADFRAKTRRTNTLNACVSDFENHSPSYKLVSDGTSKPLKTNEQLESSPLYDLSLETLSLTPSPRLASQTSPVLLSPMSHRFGTAVTASPSPHNSDHTFLHASFEPVEKNFSPSLDHVSSAEERKLMSKSESPNCEKITNPETPAHVSPTIPSYMATTESSKAKVRSNSSPRQKADTSDKNFSSAKRRLSLPVSNGKDSSENAHAHKWNSGIRTHSKAFTTSLKYARPQAV